MLAWVPQYKRGQSYLVLIAADRLMPGKTWRLGFWSTDPLALFSGVKAADGQGMSVAGKEPPVCALAGQVLEDIWTWTRSKGLRSKGTEVNSMHCIFQLTSSALEIEDGDICLSRADSRRSLSAGDHWQGDLIEFVALP